MSLQTAAFIWQKITTNDEFLHFLSCFQAQLHSLGFQPLSAHSLGLEPAAALGSTVAHIKLSARGGRAPCTEVSRERREVLSSELVGDSTQKHFIISGQRLIQSEKREMFNVMPEIFWARGFSCMVFTVPSRSRQSSCILAPYGTGWAL